MRALFALALLAAGAASAQQPLYCDPQEDLRYWVCETETPGVTYQWDDDGALGEFTPWLTPSIATFACFQGSHGDVQVRVAIFPEDSTEVTYEYMIITCIDPRRLQILYSLAFWGYPAPSIDLSCIFDSWWACIDPYYWGFDL